MKFTPKPSRYQGLREVGPYIDLGMRFALTIILGVFGGMWLDGKIGTTPLFLILGFFLGATAGFWSLYKTIYLKNPNNKNSDSE